MTEKRYAATIKITFKEYDFKSALRFNLRCKHLIERALGDLVKVECLSLKESNGLPIKYNVPVPTIECGDNFDENKLKEIFQQLEGTTQLDENGVLWRFTNGRWQAGCVPGLKEMKK